MKEIRSSLITNYCLPIMTSQYSGCLSLENSCIRRILLHFKRFQWISREIMCHYCDFNLHTCLLFTSFTVKPLNNMKSRWNCRRESSENYSESSGKLWIKWKTISTAVEMFPPRWKCFHRGDNIPTAVRMFPPRWNLMKFAVPHYWIVF